MKNRFKSLFNDKEFYSTLIKLALPIVIQSFINSFVNMIDTVMVGELGETAIASVGIANQYFLIFSMLIFGICSGTGVFISQFWGKEDVKNIRRILGISLISGVIISIILSIIAFIFPREIIAIFNKEPEVIKSGTEYLRIICISYIFTAITFAYSFGLRCIGEARISMIVSAIALVCNAFLNWVFIFGKLGAPVMGVGGAALATAIARLVEMILIVSYVYKTKNVMAAKFSEMVDLTRDFVWRTFVTVIPVVLNEACWGLATVVYTAVYGRIGTGAVAAVQICGTVQNLFMVITFGMANASTVMIGNKIGAGDEEKGREYANRFSILGVISGLVLGGLLALSAPFVLNFFKISSEVAADARRILYISSIVMSIRVFNIIMIVGILRGGGDTKFSLLAEGGTMWFIGVPLSFIGAFVLHLPVYLVVALLTAEELAKFALGLMRLLSKKWVNNVVSDMG
ncbi:MATE family efflux transporter [Clostridium malenominatum]|uniref:Probable multidrug resistance protein NorM n=1 Tax=Clostridium malenominatum TaxID=1539 RepID=A0ABN1J2Z3_9CLOT